MVTSVHFTEETPARELSPVTFKFVKSADKVGNRPISPENFIKGERTHYTLQELEARSKGELEVLGVSEEAIISLLDEGTPLETKISMPEREEASLDEVLEWATSYWNEINNRLTRKMERLSASQGKDGAVLADARVRALGVVTFISFAENYTSRESLADAARILSMASDLFIMAEFNAYLSSPDINLFSHSLNSLVNTGLARPDLFDKAVELASTNIPENIKIKHDLESRVLGIKAELLAARIMTELEISDDSVEIVVTKPYAIRDVKYDTDLVIEIEETPGGGMREISVVDVRTVGASETVGACRAYVTNGEVDYYRGDDKLPHLKESFGIEEKFIEYLKKVKEVDGLIIRLPSNLAARYTALQIAEMDKSSDDDYNDAKAQILSELRVIIERSTK